MEDIMIPTPATEKPYNRCLVCDHRRARRCDGPRTSAMAFPRWCEFMRLMKEVNHLTNAQIAERSDVSIKTIERIMSGKIDQDIYRDTARRIEDVIIGSSNQYPCYLAFEERAPQESTRLHDALRELEHALDENRDYRKILDSISASHTAELQAVRTEYIEKIAFLRAQMEHLQRENDDLWAENKRKSRIVDLYIDSHMG